MVAGLVAAVMGGSNVQVSGPTGAMVVVLAPVVAAHGVGSIALVSVLAGLLVVVLGVSGLGRAVAFIPWPVVEGFTLGIAAIIFLQQVPLATGTEGTPGHNTLLAAVESASQATVPTVLQTLAVVAGVAAVMYLLPRLQQVPAREPDRGAARHRGVGAAGAGHTPDRRASALPAGALACPLSIRPRWAAC